MRQVPSLSQVKPRFKVTIMYSLYTSAALVILTSTLLVVCHHTPHEPNYSHHQPYNFGYDLDDGHGNKQWRQEKSINPMEVHGSYGYQDNNGVYREVVYVADKNGYRASITTNEPGVTASKHPASVRIEPHHSPMASGSSLKISKHHKAYNNQHIR